MTVQNRISGGKHALDPRKRNDFPWSYPSISQIVAGIAIGHNTKKLLLKRNEDGFISGTTLTKWLNRKQRNIINCGLIKPNESLKEINRRAGQEISYTVNYDLLTERMIKKFALEIEKEKENVDKSITQIIKRNNLLVKSIQAQERIIKLDTITADDLKERKEKIRKRKWSCRAYMAMASQLTKYSKKIEANQKITKIQALNENEKKFLSNALESVLYFSLLTNNKQTLDDVIDILVANIRRGKIIVLHHGDFNKTKEGVPLYITHKVCPELRLLYILKRHWESKDKLEVFY